MKRYAIYGAGSLGTVLGAYITKNGGNIDLINRNKAHVAALNEKGARITGKTEMLVKVRAYTPDQMEGKYDVILLMTKQLLNKEVVTFLKDYLLDDGVIVTMGTNVGKNCVVGAGSVVTKDLPDNVVAYGVPCRAIRENSYE